MPTLRDIKFGILGQFFHCPVKGDFEYQKDMLILVNHEGKIVSVISELDNEYQSSIATLSQDDLLIRLSDSEYLMPGMVDLHIHAPQWPQAGKGLDLPLYDWLQDYTFPLESKFENMSFAKEVYPHLVKSLLSNGTTSGVYFATIHKDTSLELAKECLRQGQRAFIGKVNMDDKTQCPSFYVENSIGEALAETEEFISDVLTLDGNENGLVFPVITPRFVPSCTKEMLKGLGELAEKYKCHIQTHCSESDWARDYSIEKYGKSDVHIYNDFGLMTDKTILAHSIFMSESDFQIIKSTGAAIAHCPFSNMYFANASMQTREVLDDGIKCGLGSDIAGAPNSSIFRSCLDAVSYSRVREDGTSIKLPQEKRGEKNKRITFLEAYWLATVGGGQVLGSNTGLFKKGYEFDALIVDTSIPDTDIYILNELDSPKDILEKIISLNSRQNIRKVWVQGELVIDKEKHKKLVV